MARVALPSRLPDGPRSRMQVSHGLHQIIFFPVPKKRSKLGLDRGGCAAADQSARRQLQGARTQMRCPLRSGAGLHALPALVLDGSFHFAAITCRILVSTSSTHCCEIRDTSRTASFTYMVGDDQARGARHMHFWSSGGCATAPTAAAATSCLHRCLVFHRTPAAGKAGIFFVNFNDTIMIEFQC